MDEEINSQLDLLAALCNGAVARHGDDIPSIVQFVHDALDNLPSISRLRFHEAIGAYLRLQHQEQMPHSSEPVN
jgi:hypothetical protein